MSTVARPQRPRGLARPRPALHAVLGRGRLPLVIVALIASLYLLLPLIAILPASLSGSAFLGFPPQGLSSRWYSAVLADPDWIDSFSRSLRVSAAGASIAVASGTLAALGLVRLRRGARQLRALFIVPLVIPGIAYALGLSSLLLHLHIVSGEWSIAVGQALLALPAVVVVVSSALSGVDPALPLAAQGLGAAWWRVVWRVELPLVWHSVAGAFVVAFTLCFDELVVALFLGAPSSDTVPTHILSQSQDSLGPDIAAVGVLVILSAFVLLGGAALLLRQGARRRR